MYETIKKRLLSNTFTKNLALILSGNIAAKAIGILSTPIITRLYSPEDYGVFSVFLSIVAIVGSLATLRYAITIPLADSDKAADDIIKLCLFITLLVSILSYGIVFFAGEHITQAFHVEKLSSYLWVLPLAFFATGVYQTFNNWAVRERDFKLITKTILSRSIYGAVGKVILGLIGLKPLGLIIGLLIQEVSGNFVFVKRFLRARPSFFRKLDLSSMKVQAVRFRKFPLIQSWSQLILSLGAQLPVLLIGYFYDIKTAGVFGLAQNMINMPMNLIGQSVSQVYYAEIAKFGKKNKNKIYILTVSVMKKMLLVGLIPTLILLLFSPWLFELVFGTQWKAAGIYSQILASMILFRFVSNPIASVLNVMEKQSIQLFLNSIRVILVVFVFYMSSVYELSPIKAVLLFSVTVSVYYILLSAFILMLLKEKETEFESYK